ncbi:L-aspartate oxidase [[Limnothrix rosea] IAM M-220]|uniref:L-aspartate oxidase n=1 Tax=[Limnothrix rosea] IAM M-220 TaxID=454133 RepID=UPI000962F851|nr:L-aspartate oxidase [[Limnothrix rosea] IAM M-220]OKH19356.1 L-aspartate oxidase [[Limnothrix rosea] IAM M-220]
MTSETNLPKQFDVVVIGSGAAGLYAALSLPSHLRVGLITKAKLRTGSSKWAQGGIAAAIAPTDSPDLHFTDTIKAGAGLCDPAAVSFLVNNAKAAIHHLVDMGVDFDRKNGELAMTLEAAHSRPRVLHSKDTTGKAIITTLIEKVLERPNIHVVSQAFALQLRRDQTGRCCGVSVLYDGCIHWLSSGAVILATGGGGQVFAQTTNPTVSTGDGVALAWRLGAQLRDLEFFQFHPTALTKPGAPRFLISEAVRGEGAHLLGFNGDRFVFGYHPDGELAPRDVVSRAIFSYLAENAGDPANAHVYLDLSVIPEEEIRRRFPNIIRMCAEWGVDVFSEPIPVAPAAHYWMGGIKTKATCETSISGLYAIGETSSTGVHGANRLASNSLLECLVFAAQLHQFDPPNPDAPEENISPKVVAEHWRRETVKVQTIRADLPFLLWQSAGICRHQQTLDEAIAQVSHWRDQLQEMALAQFLQLREDTTIEFEHPDAETELRLYAETCNLADVAWLILKSAAWRTESRGGHYRLDYPATQPDWQVHTFIEGEEFRRSPLVE